MDNIEEHLRHCFLYKYIRGQIATEATKNFVSSEGAIRV